MASSFGSKRHRVVKTRGGKSWLCGVVTLGYEMGGIEDLLNQTQFFSEWDQMIQYATQYTRGKFSHQRWWVCLGLENKGFNSKSSLISAFANICHALTCLLWWLDGGFLFEPQDHSRW